MTFGCSMVDLGGASRRAFSWSAGLCFKTGKPLRLKTHPKDHHKSAKIEVLNAQESYWQARLMIQLPTIPERLSQPLAQMESLQSVLPAVLPCKHQRCVVPTCSNIGRRKLWQIVAKTAAIIAMVLNFLSALWMLLSPHPSSESENPPSTPRIPDFLAHT